MKFVLGVHRKSSNDAVRGDLGRYPLFICIFKQQLKYYRHLLDSNSDSLIYNALQASKELPNSCNTWLKHIHDVLRITGIRDLGQSRDDFLPSDIWISTVIKKLKERYTSYWEKTINNNDGKLRTYKLFKNRFCMENYLSSRSCIRDLESRKCLSRLRISAHNLEIERGRYTRPITPIENRICNLCKLETGDEIHFLIKCKKLDKVRKPYISSIVSLNPNFNNLDCENKFIYCMVAEDDIALITGKLTKSLNNERDKLLVIT